MIPFGEVWEYMKEIPGSFTETNARKLYEHALGCSGMIAEIGVDQCRSGSVLAFAAMETGASLIFVDIWESVLIGNRWKVFRRLSEDFSSVQWMVLNMFSVDAAKAMDVNLSLVHIDANHLNAGPEEDCGAWLPKLNRGGVACFHDYASRFDAVDVAVDKHTAGWQDLGNWEGLAIRRRP